ncbi:MAG: hypothetical protein ACREI8_04670, partial [Myxococcota bacterium]
MSGGIDHLIINSPFTEPAEHWAYEREAKRFVRREGRRPAGYVIATPGIDSQKYDDPGQFIELPLVNRIRPRVAAWRAAGYPGVTGTTKRLLEHWADPERERRFSKHVLAVAPGLTVKNRLQVLEPSHAENYYDAFDVVPSALRDRLRQGRVLVRNWHALAWESEERLAKRRSVDKRGAKSDEAYVREVLGELASAHQLLVVNDEAHHAWRVPAEKTGASKAELEEAT